jgi:hypothetical protein
MAKARLFRIAAALAAASAIATGAVAQPNPQQQQGQECFLRSNINGFNAPDDHTLYVRVGVNEIWRLDLMSGCPDLTFRQSFGLESTPANPWICSPLDATVVFHETGIPERCPVTAMHKLTPDEVAALPKKNRP